MVIRCKVVEGMWYPLQLEDKGQVTPIPSDQPIAQLVDGQVKDLRENPPYYQLLPCPYCGVTEDKGHHPIPHLIKGAS